MTAQHYDLPPPVEPDWDEPPPPEPDHTHTTGPRAPLDAAVEAEHAFLGALLVSPEIAAENLHHVDPSDYYQPRHEILHQAIAELVDQGLIPDHPTLVAHLHTTGQLHQAGGHEHLLALRDHAGTQLDHYATIIRDAAGLRRLDQRLIRMRQRIDTARPDELHNALADLSDLADQAATNFTPNAGGPSTGLKDLTWILDGEPPTQPPPAYTIRADGTALFYAGKVNGIFGDPEAAKTWLAQTAIVQALNNGQSAAMIDVDHNGPDHTCGRLLLLGARLEHLADPDRFRYYEPEDGPELHAAVADIANHAPAVVIIDSLGEVFPLLAVKTNDPDEVTIAMRQVCTRIANTGACVITIDHLPKSTEARQTGFAIGAIAKKRMTRGSYLRAEARTQPAPGSIGRITLRIEKDTSGELRKSSGGGGYAGTFTIDSTQPGITRWTIDREVMPKNDDGTLRPTGLMERISRFIEDHDQCTFTDIKDAVQGKDKWLRDSITILVTEGFVARLDGARRAKLHHSIAPYRETEDDHAS